MICKRSLRPCRVVLRQVMAFANYGQRWLHVQREGRIELREGRGNLKRMLTLLAVRSL